MERHYILASHGMFSQGIYDSIRIILGEKKHVHLITAYVKDGQDISDPMLMNLFLFSDEDADKLIRRLFTEAKTGIMYCNETVKGITSQEDEF